jgi:hypothetical protein
MSCASEHLPGAGTVSAIPLRTREAIEAKSADASRPSAQSCRRASPRSHRESIFIGPSSAPSQSGTPYFSFKDIDENKPSGSIKIRVETIHYFLKPYVEDMQKRPASEADLDRALAAYEQQLRDQLLREAELAALAERQQGLAEEMKLSRTLLPIVSPANGVREASHPM